MADSVFQYFQDTEYGMHVLEKMWKKAKKMVVITEIHDESMKEEHLNYRRQCVENYDEKYKGLDKTFYTKDMFLKFAEKTGARCDIVKPQNELYWNNKYVFDCSFARERENILFVLLYTSFTIYSIGVANCSEFTNVVRFSY